MFTFPFTQFVIKYKTIKETSSTVPLTKMFNFFQPVDEAMKKDIEAALKAFVKKEETILLTTKVDPNIIGGMIVSIGDKYVDMSIASKVKKFTDVITAAV